MFSIVFGGGGGGGDMILVGNQPMRFWQEPWIKCINRGALKIEAPFSFRHNWDSMRKLSFLADVVRGLFMTSGGVAARREGTYSSTVRYCTRTITQH